MKTLCSALAALMFSLASIGAATVDLDVQRGAGAAQFAAAATPLQG